MKSFLKRIHPELCDLDEFDLKVFTKVFTSMAKKELIGYIFLLLRMVKFWYKVHVVALITLIISIIGWFTYKQIVFFAVVGLLMIWIFLNRDYKKLLKEHKKTVGSKLLEAHQKMLFRGYQ